MFDIGAEKIIFILLIALVVLGPDELPGIARKIGNLVHQLRQMAEGFQSEIRHGLEDSIGPPDDRSGAR